MIAALLYLMSAASNVRDCQFTNRLAPPTKPHPIDATKECIKLYQCTLSIVVATGGVARV